RANTSRHKAMSHKRMLEAEAQLEDEIAQILMQMDELNVREEEEHSDGDGGGGLPAELQRREQRREKIRAARQQLEREKGEKLEDRHQKSFADLEANMMKTGEGAMQYCYNAQAATSEDGIVVASAVSTSPSDAPQLVPMIDAVRENTGQRPELALADAGYRSEQNLSALRRRRQRCLVAIGRGGQECQVADGALHPTHASALSLALGTRAVRPPQDPGRAALRRDQAADAFPSLRAPRPGKGTRRMGPCVRGAQRRNDLASAGGMSRPLRLLPVPAATADAACSHSRSRLAHCRAAN